MKSLGLSLFLCAAAALSQTAPPAPAPPPPAEKGDTVIAIFEDGGKITLDEFQALVPGLPPQFQQMAQQDRQKFLHYYAMMRKLSQMAEQEKLDQHSPYKEVLAYSRLSTLTDIKLKDVLDSVTVTPEEVEKLYSEHKEPYKSVKVSAICIWRRGILFQPGQFLKLRQQPHQEDTHRRRSQNQGREAAHAGPRGCGLQDAGEREFRRRNLPR